MRSAHGEQPHEVRGLLVDQRNKLGFAYSGASIGPLSPVGIAVYDLESRMLAAHISHAQIDDQTGQSLHNDPSFDATQLILDEERQQILGLPRLGGTACDRLALDYFRDEQGWTLQARPWRFPCPPGHLWAIHAMSFDERSGKAYASLRDSRQNVRETASNQALGVGVHEGAGDPLIVAQVNVSGNEPELDWQVDLAQSGCGRRDRDVLWVQRTPGAVLTYCYDINPWRGFLGIGHQGYVVAIPMEGDVPLRPDGEPASIDPVTRRAADAMVRRTPALPGRVTPFADPETGMLLLLTSGSPNGNAFWVFDPEVERFIGSVTGGVIDEPAHSNSFGFDSGRSRGYLLTADGVLVAPLGRLPLPTGDLFPVLMNPEREPGFVPTWGAAHRPHKADRIGVVTEVSDCGGCTRLFVPLARVVPCSGNPEDRCAGYAVLDDHLPETPAPEPDDPDQATTQVDEDPRTTARVVSGRALVAGAQVIATGGAPRTIDQSAPSCHPPDAGPIVESIRRQAFESFNDGCLAELLLAGGHRQLALAHADVDIGSSTGADAEAAGLTFAEQDHATDPELKRLGECYASTFESSSGSSFPASPACSALQGAFTSATGDDLGRGTAGGTDEEPRDGFPVPASHCLDFGGSASTAQQPETREGLRARAFSSSVACDAEQPAGGARASSAGFALPDPADPLVSVASTATEAHSSLTDEGQVTVVSASAYGVQVGPLSIAEVRSVARSRAKGRTDSARAELTRLWCGVWFEGRSVEEDCLDATSAEARSLADAVSQALGRVRINIPRASREATPGGFQSVVTKHPEERGADRTVNDDDSHTVSGMQVTIYNDGAEGRNRYVVQLAGVHTEARYGIILLPQFLAFENDTPVLPQPGEAGSPGSPGTPAREELIEEVVHPGDRVVPVAHTDPADEGSLLRRLLDSPGETVREGLRWLWNNPREAALLLLLWTVLSVPVYLALRRRSFERALAAGRAA